MTGNRVSALQPNTGLTRLESNSDAAKVRMAGHRANRCEFLIDMLNQEGLACRRRKYIKQ